jgi:hypothetical protein
MLLTKPSKLLTYHQLQCAECYKKGLEALMGYSTNLNEQKVPFNVYPEISAC